MNRFQERSPLFSSLVFACFILSLFATSCSDDGESPASNEELIRISVGQLDVSYDVWFFISDEDGNMLDVKQVTANTQVVFTRPDNHKAETFSFNIFTVASMGEMPELRMVRWLGTYSDLAPGRFLKYGFHGEIENPATKPFTVNVSGVTADFEAVLSVPNIVTSVTSFQNGILTMDNFAGDDASAFLYVHDSGIQNGRYKFLENIESNKVFDFSYDDLIPVEERLIDVGIENLDELYTGQSGYFGAYNGQGGYTLNSTSHVLANHQVVPEKIRLIQPDNLFQTYAFGFAAVKGNITYSYGTVSSTLPTSFPILAVDLTQHDFDAESLSLSVNGEADQAFISLENISQANGITYDDTWAVFTPVSNQILVKRPNFPGELPSEKIANFYSGPVADIDAFIRFSDFERYHGYSSLWSADEEEMDLPNQGYSKYKYYTIDSDGEGGRVSTHKLNPAISDLSFVGSVNN